MNRMLPDSLFGRLMSALLAAIVLSALVVALLIERERREAAFWRSDAADLISLITQASSALAAMSPEERGEALAAWRREPLTLHRRHLAGEVSHEELVAAARAYQARLESAFGGQYRVLVRPAVPGDGDVIHIGVDPRAATEAQGEEVPRLRDGPAPEGAVRLRRDQALAQADTAPEGENFLRGADGLAGAQGPAAEQDDAPRRMLLRVPGDSGAAYGPLPALLDVGIDLPGRGMVTFRAAVPPPAPALPSRIFLELGGVTLLLGAVLLVMTRGITLPLSELSRSADAMGRGKRLAPLREKGAREVREATRAFNVMQERLHRYLDSRTRVLAAMSHDLRTPLTRLRLRAEDIDDARAQAKFVADLDEMDHMVRNALDMFRGIDQSEELEAIDVAMLLRQLASEFGELGATVQVEGEANPIPLRPRAIKRCLANLVSNAVKFGVAARIQLQDGEDLVIRVRDDGPGIPEHALDQVFEPFFRLEASRNADTGGVGLGLGIARDIAQAHGGSLVLRNLHPRGLEAVLSLPRESD